MNPGISLYEMLNITRDASAEEIREAYFEAARRYHPDVNTDKNANEQFMHIQQAYETLLDSAKRARYDTELAKMDDQAGVRVDTYYSVARIPQLAEPQVVYVLLEFNCLARKEKSQPPPVHVCLVIDCSTSMQGERLDLVKTNVLQLVRQLRVQDILSVVTFNDRAEKLIVDARGVEHKGAENQISLLMASGGTEIFKGLEAGMSLLRPTKGRATRLMILITDGRTYGDA
jgi:Ca-activated chloride channel family protein